MSKSDVLTQGDVLELVYTWFRCITEKADLHEVMSLLTNDELEMHFPEVVIQGASDFQSWYESVTTTFFDQVHDIKLLAIDLDGEKATVTLIVNWQARTWQAPAATSTWQGYNVHQKWMIRRDPSSGKPVIARYYVGAFDPMQNQPG